MVFINVKLTPVGGISTVYAWKTKIREHGGKMGILTIV